MDEDRKSRLRDLLNEQNKWPAVYMFKFVIPNDNAKLIKLKLIFNESAEFSTRQSGKGNYLSVTVKEMMMNADSIFDRYREAAEIEGILSL